MTRTSTRRLADVAQKVGVSEATVSRVLNGKPGVSDATREVVLTALDVLGYERPTQLRGDRARLIGLVLPELQNPIFPALAEVVGGALAQRGFTPVLCTRTAGGLSESDYVAMLLDQRAVTDAVYRRALDCLGEAGVIELTGLCGYYALLAMILNVSQTGSPEGGSVPFDLPRAGDGASAPDRD